MEVSPKENTFIFISSDYSKVKIICQSEEKIIPLDEQQKIKIKEEYGQMEKEEEYCEECKKTLTRKRHRNFFPEHVKNSWQQIKSFNWKESSFASYFGKTTNSYCKDLTTNQELEINKNEPFEKICEMLIGGISQNSRDLLIFSILFQKQVFICKYKQKDEENSTLSSTMPMSHIQSFSNSPNDEANQNNSNGSKEMNGENIHIFNQNSGYFNENNCDIKVNGKKMNFTSTISLTKKKLYETIAFEMKSGAKLNNLSYLFQGCENLEEISLINIDMEDIKSIEGMCKDCNLLEAVHFIGLKNTSNIENVNNLFSGCKVLKLIDGLNTFDFRNIKTMRYMFQNCSSLNTIDLSSFKTENVEDISGMFENCTKINELDFSFFKTDKLKHLRSLCSGCSSLNTIINPKFNTENVKEMDNIFNSCVNLSTTKYIEHEENHDLISSSVNSSSMLSVDIEISSDNEEFKLSFNMKNVTTIEKMFYKCLALKFVDLRECIGLNQIDNQNELFGECLPNIKVLGYQFQPEINIPNENFYLEPEINSSLENTNLMDDDLINEFYELTTHNEDNQELFNHNLNSIPQTHNESTTDFSVFFSFTSYS